jgi:hypothetical protein
VRKRELACSYCGAKPKEPCIITLAPEVTVSQPWKHRTRIEKEERAA